MVNPNDILEKIRYSRDKLLAETDWMASTDVTMPSKIATYRQALRDLPATANVYFVVFPDKPSDYAYATIDKPFNPTNAPDSWTLNETTCLWEAPVKEPVVGDWTWDEATTNWIEVTGET